MTNFENKKDECMKILAGNMALVDGKPVLCEDTNCHNCGFYKIESRCDEQAMEWLLAEYQEPAPKLTKREREFLECFELKSDLEIMRACVSGMLFVVSKDSTFSQRISHDMFSFIVPYHTWTFEELMKLEVEE